MRSVYVVIKMSRSGKCAIGYSCAPADNLILYFTYQNTEFGMWKFCDSHIPFVDIDWSQVTLRYYIKLFKNSRKSGYSDPKINDEFLANLLEKEERQVV